MMPGHTNGLADDMLLRYGEGTHAWRHGRAVLGLSASSLNVLVLRIL